MISVLSLDWRNGAGLGRLELGIMYFNNEGLMADRQRFPFDLTGEAMSADFIMGLVADIKARAERYAEREGINVPWKWTYDEARLMYERYGWRI